MTGFETHAQEQNPLWVEPRGVAVVGNVKMKLSLRTILRATVIGAPPDVGLDSIYETREPRSGFSGGIIVAE